MYLSVCNITFVMFLTLILIELQKVINNQQICHSLGRGITWISPLLPTTASFCLGHYLFNPLRPA